MNQTPKEIYDDYCYELLKIKVKLEQTPETFSTRQSFERVAKRVDQLELLIDLYAYLLANVPRG